MKYGRMRQLTSSDNLDNITDNGIYWYPTESVPQNAPYQNAAVVEVIGSTSATGEKFQRVTRYGVPGKSSWRPLGGGSNGWLAWAESLTNADFIYANSVSELLSKMESRQTARTYTLHAGKRSRNRINWIQCVLHGRDIKIERDNVRSYVHAGVILMYCQITKRNYIQPEESGNNGNLNDHLTA